MSLLFKGAEQLLLRFMQKTKCSSCLLRVQIWMQQPTLHRRVCESHPICPPVLQRILAEIFFWMNSIIKCWQIFWPSLLLNCLYLCSSRPLLLHTDANVHEWLVLLWHRKAEPLSVCAEANPLVSFPLWTFTEIAVLFWLFLRDFSDFRAKYNTMQ